MKRLALLAALALPASAHAAETTTVSMPGKRFDPSRLTVVAGDAILFRNADLVAHDVKGAAFDSGSIARFATFTQRFDTVGRQPFVCSIHPFMAGEVDVVASTLTASAGTLQGRAPAGTTSVAIERQAPDGSWGSAGVAALAPDGSFTAHVTGAGAYRATTAAGASATVTVSDRVSVKLTVSGHRLRVTGGEPGLEAKFQAYSRERYAWRGFARVELDARGRASIRHRGALKGLVRVVVTRDGVTAGVSEAIRLRDGRAGSMPGGHAPHHDQSAAAAL